MENRGDIIITGGAGFIGSNVALALNARGRSDLIIVDHLEGGEKKNLEKIKHEQYFDRDDFLPALKKGDLGAIEAVLHFGACTDTTVTDEQYMLKYNTEYSKALFDFCTENRIKFIYASSAATYGDGAAGYDDNERSLRPLNIYQIIQSPAQHPARRRRTGP